MEIPEILEIKEQLETKSLKSIITELLQNEETEYNITNRLLKELMNIKHALKSSSYEIQQIFQYPLKLMSRNYSIGKIQMEVFHDIILKDNIINELISQIKEKSVKCNTNEILYLISIIEDNNNYQYKELTDFKRELKLNRSEYSEGINDSKRKSLNMHNNKTNNTNNKDLINNNNDNKNGLVNKRNKNTPTSSSPIENQSYNAMANNNKPTKNSKKQKNKKNKANLNEEYEKIQAELFKGNIDDLMQFICSDDHKKKKKKKNKNKGKDNYANNNVDINRNNETELNKENTNSIKNNENVNACHSNNNDMLKNGNTDEIEEYVNYFKKKLLNNSVLAYKYNKIIPCFSEGWVNGV
jgi:hypothetical protein